MTAAPPPARWPPPRVGPLEVALFAIGMLVSGLVVMALAWSGKGAYGDIARANGVDHAVFIAHDPGGDTAVRIELPEMREMHGVWSSYVTGGPDQPAEPEHRFFSSDEFAHMADVRGVFAGARLMVPVGLFLMAFRLVRARAISGDAALRLARDGSLVAAGIVALIGIAAAVAFEPLFLLFHRVFFPQGNYLFDPATSNLVRLYPDWYWEGITLRVGASFEAIALSVAAVTTLALRRMK